VNGRERTGGGVYLLSWGSVQLLLKRIYAGVRGGEGDISANKPSLTIAL